MSGLFQLAHDEFCSIADVLQVVMLIYMWTDDLNVMHTSLDSIKK